jgi:alpha-tubulin suppressor-like RCC1 family protein
VLRHHEKLTGLERKRMKSIVSVSGVAICLLATGFFIGCDKSPTTSDHIAGPRLAAVGPVAQLAFTVQPSTAVAGAQITPAVQVTAQDAQGNTVTTYTSKITVALATYPSGAKLGGTVTTNAKSGVATFSNLSITKAATGYTLSATSGTLTTATSAPFDITPGAASKIVFTVQPTPTAAGDPITPAVQVSAEDAFNNVATTYGGSVSLTLRSCSSGAVLSGASAVTAVGGVATFGDLSVNKSGNCGLTATSSSFTAKSATFVIGPAAPTSLQFTAQPSKTKAGVAINPAVKVTARDQFGNTASGFTGQVVMSIATGPAGVTLLGTTTVAAASGTASFTNLVIQKIGSYTLQASATGLTAATSNGFLVVPNSPTHLAFTVQPSTTAPGAQITPAVEVTVRDAYDNTVPNAGSVTMAIGSNPGGGTLSGTLSESAATGVATFADLRINNPGAGYTLVATLGILPSATSAPFDIPGAATHLAFTVQPSNTAAGSMITPAVEVIAQDAQGNKARSFTGSVTVAIGSNLAGGTLGGTTTVIAQAGVAAFSDLMIDKAGTAYTLQASSPGLASSTSSAFDVTAVVSQIQPEVSAGSHHTCALKTDGTVACWGDNSYGQAPATQAPPAGTTFIKVAAGGSHTCALKSDGAAACWGDNTYGQAPATQAPPSGTTFTQVSAGLFHTCALVSDGTIGCWGFNGYGAAPGSQAPPAGTTFTQVSAGGYNTCARVSDGSVACWGDNSAGQTPATQIPPAGTTFTQVAAGGTHVCSLQSDGAVGCWGNNADGEAPANRAPTAGTTFTQVSAGGDQTCAVVSDGTIGCWGANYLGEAPPSQVPPAGTTFTQVSAGANHTCGLRSDGAVACWGWDGYGQATPPPGFNVLVP